MPTRAGRPSPRLTRYAGASRSRICVAWLCSLFPLVALLRNAQPLPDPYQVGIFQRVRIRFEDLPVQAAVTVVVLRDFPERLAPLHLVPLGGVPPRAFRLGPHRHAHPPLVSSTVVTPQNLPDDALPPGSHDGIDNTAIAMPVHCSEGRGRPGCMADPEGTLVAAAQDLRAR